MYEIETTKQANDLLEVYRSLYQKKYAIEPIIQSLAAASTIFKDLIRKVGHETARRLLERYLEQDGDNAWYKRNGHSLTVFNKNAEVLVAQVGLSERKQISTNGRGVQIQLTFYCDNSPCRNSFTLVCYGDEIDKRHLCPACKERSCKVVA